MTQAQQITRLLGGKWSGRSGSACCPAHKDKRPSLSLSDGGNGRLLLKCYAGCEFIDILNALRNLGVLSGDAGCSAYNPLCEAERRAQEQAHNVKRSRQALRVWSDAKPISVTLAERYALARGITCKLPSTLRYASACWHPSAKRFPAMIAKVEGLEGFAVHRTYLLPDGSGKAKVFPNKAMLGVTKGGAVRLSKSSRKLVVAEGIETALSLVSGTFHDCSVWAALSASGMKALRLPDQPGRLVIAPDGDKVGRDACRGLAEQAHALGWHVSFLTPPDGYDWNDVLTGKAVAA